MKWQIGLVGLMALTLGACAGNEGNPNGAAYANEAGGTIAVAPQTIGVETYDATASSDLAQPLGAPPPGPGMTSTPR